MSININDQNAISNECSSKIYRNANYSGGEPGWVNSALYSVTDVNANATAFEWGITAVLNNYATAGENVAIYGQGNQYSASAPTWAGVFEAREHVQNTHGNLRGIEVDVFTNNLLTAGQDKIGVDIVYGRSDDTGADGSISAGLRIAPKTGSINSKCSNGIVLSGIMDTAIAMDCTAYKAFGIYGTNTYGFDASGGNVEIALKMKHDSMISFNETDTAQMKFNATSGNFEFYYNGTLIGHIVAVGGSDHAL